jgi:uncharacterized protein YjbJ (UPF0337 family)
MLTTNKPNKNQVNNIMTTLEIKGDWNIIKGKLKQKWATLTDHDLQYVEGKQEELLGHIQKITGETREAIEKAINESCHSDHKHTHETQPAGEKASGDCCSSSHSDHKHADETHHATASLNIPIIHPAPASEAAPAGELVK